MLTSTPADPRRYLVNHLAHVPGQTGALSEARETGCRAVNPIAFALGNTPFSAANFAHPGAPDGSAKATVAVAATIAATTRMPTMSSAFG